MAYLGPKNKIKVKSSKPNEFIYYDDSTPFNGSYLQTSKGEYYEGDDISSPGRVLIPSQNNRRKFNLLALLKTLLAIAASIALILQVLEELKSIMTDLAELAEIENMIEELLNIPDGESLSEQNLSNLNNSLNQFPTENFPVSNNIVVHDGVYNNIKTNIYNRLNTNQSPISTKILPSEQDYIKGSYIRYFAKKVNSLNYYIEIDKTTYNSIKKREKTFDVNLYIVSKIKWDLSISAREINTNNLNRYKKPFPNIELLFNDPIEYAPVGRANLYAEAGELYYIDGTPYIGEYHIHPTKGPMVGAIHKAEPHDDLYYSYELGQSIEELQINVVQEETQTGLHRTIGFYKFYIKENKLGLYVEVMDETEAEDGIINTIHISKIYNRNTPILNILNTAQETLGL
tara:strand:- start:209 stop:1411 length:1203 start_codon:yes stop_codon:yes gene_type:complete